MSFALDLSAKMECHTESPRRPLIDESHPRAVHKGYTRYEGWLPCFSWQLTGLVGEVWSPFHSNPAITSSRMKGIKCKWLNSIFNIDFLLSKDLQLLRYVHTYTVFSRTETTPEIVVAFHIATTQYTLFARHTRCTYHPRGWYEIWRIYVRAYMPLNRAKDMRCTVIKIKLK